jgi:RNA-binding protein 15
VPCFSQLDDVQRRLSISPAHAIFIGLPTMNPPPPPPPEDASVQDRPLKHLVGYLKQKDAAGVISVQSNKGVPTGVVYAFPPCHFSFELLRASSPNIIEDDSKEDHVVIVMVTGGI